ncbi:MAG TPA: response regulator transcription factor, partial [Thermoanaerobacterales bacterium]|nr:response regulator transcription factor [Thermoanaerobacterales bacterium]
MSKINVLIVDDHALMRQGLRKILEMEENIQVVGVASNGIEALGKAKRLNPDVVLMDINMPQMSGIDTTKLFKKEGIKSGIIILTIYDEPEYLFAGIKAGAQGFILKDVDST